MTIHVVSSRINNQICKSIPESILLNCFLELCDLSSRSTHFLRKFFNFLFALSLTFSLHIKSLHAIRYIKAQINKKINRSLLIGLNFI